MPKTVEYCNKGVREVYSKKGCNSCWNCKHCDVSVYKGYVCLTRRLSTHININFPYDNTKCKEFEQRNGEN